MMGNDRRRDHRVLLLAGLPLAAAVVLPVRLLTAGDSDTSTAPPVPVRPLDPATSGQDVEGRMVSAGPTEQEWGIAAGYGRSPAGARAAAVGWVAALGELMRMGPIALSDSLGGLMTARAAGETLPTLKEERQRFIDTFGVDPLLGLWLEAPLTVDLVAFGEDRAVVKVWSQLLMGSKLGEVSGLYRTQTVTVVWERDDWRVDDVTRMTGPTPVLVDGELPSPGVEFIGPMQEWVPAVSAGTVMPEGAG